MELLWKISLFFPQGELASNSCQGLLSNLNSVVRNCAQLFSYCSELRGNYRGYNYAQVKSSCFRRRNFKMKRISDSQQNLRQFGMLSVIFDCYVNKEPKALQFCKLPKILLESVYIPSLAQSKKFIEEFESFYIENLKSV